MRPGEPCADLCGFRSFPKHRPVPASRIATRGLSTSFVCLRLKHAGWLNDAAEVVGLATPKGDTALLAFLWNDGVMKNLGTLPGDGCSAADSINSNEVRGRSSVFSGHATIKDGNSTLFESILGSHSVFRTRTRSESAANRLSRIVRERLCFSASWIILKRLLAKDLLRQNRNRNTFPAL